jgi:hypothetical protein
MYQPLVACPSCHRHVRVTEACCPFCSGILPGDLASRAVPSASGRMSRAAAFVFGASLAVTGCGSEVLTETSGGVGSGSSSDGSSGAPSSSSASSGGSAEDGGTSVDDGGEPPPIDAGLVDDGGISADYGAPPPPPDDGGAPKDDGGWQPLYGAAPLPASE